MSLAGVSVRRPVSVCMMMLIVVVLGAFSLQRLPIDLMPEITYPTLTVSTSYSNASPESIEELITRPIEEAVSVVPGVQELTSISAEGVSDIRISFEWGTNLDAAANDLRERLDAILGDLPADADRPQLRRFDPSDFPILIVGVSSHLDPIELRTLIDDQVRHRLERIRGVAAVQRWGGLRREIHVNLDPDRLRALNIPIDSVLQAIRDANVNIPAGSIEQGNYDVTIRTPGEFTSLDELRDMAVATRDGVVVRLGQIASIDDTHQRLVRIVRINGEPGVRLAIRKQAGTNTVDVARRAKAEVERLNAEFPQLDLVPIIDQSDYIERALANVGRTVLYGGALAVLVLLLFLRNLRSTLIIAAAIPISIIGTFAMVFFGGFTLNLMTLGGLALGVGMMVDNAIVVLENIYRVREHEHAHPWEAAIRGTNEVTAAVVASTITTLVIFMPLVFVEGISGVLFLPLAAVVAFSLLCSLFVALTLVPVMASRLMKRHPEPSLKPDGRQLPRAPRHGAFFTSIGWVFAEIEGAYRDILGAALNSRVLTLALLLTVGGATVLLMPRIGTELMPSADESEVRINLEMDVGTRILAIEDKMRIIEAIAAAEVPETRASVMNIGTSPYRPEAGATGELNLSLVPANQRTRSSAEVARDLRRSLADIPGGTVRTREGSGLFLLRVGSGGGEALSIEVRGFDLNILDQLASLVGQAIEDIPGITDVRLTREVGVPQEIIRIDRDRAADLGVSVSRIARTLGTAIAGTRVGEYREGGQEVRMLVKVRDAEQLELEEVLDFLVPNDRGELVALQNMVDTAPQRGPILIERKNQQRTNTVSANISGRDLGSIVADIRERLRDVPVPANHEIVIAGDYEEQQEAFVQLAMSLVLSLLLVYMVLASLYESFRDPLVVMCSVPFAAIGVVLILYLTGTTLNIQSFIGCIMLGGIVVNNAILIVDRATSLRTELALSPREAVREAAVRRFRPILMTSLTTILGLLPLALGLGEGAEAQAPLARAVIGGLLTAMVITLVVIPVLYTVAHPQKDDPEPLAAR